MNASQSSLTVVLHEALRLYRNHRLPAAATMLRASLAPYDPATSTGDPAVIRAAILYAASAVDDPDSQLSYALFAERSSHRTFGPDSELTRVAMHMLAGVAEMQKLFGDAATACQRLIEVHTRRGDHSDALVWRTKRAVMLFSDGQCDHALDEIVACTNLAAGLPQPERDAAMRAVLIWHAAILAGCGYTTAASALLRQHRDLLAPANGTDPDVGEALIADTIHRITEAHPRPCAGACQREDRTVLSYVDWMNAVHDAVRATDRDLHAGHRRSSGGGDRR